MEPFFDLLPAEFLAEDVLPYLSLDTQAYFCCSNCDWEWRLNPAADLRTPVKCVGMDCPSGDGGSLAPVSHNLRQETVCLECKHSWNVSVGAVSEPVRCSACGSRSYFPLSTSWHPPTRFKNLSMISDEQHIWGVDAGADCGMIHKELRGIMQWRSDRANYLIPAFRFAGRLNRFNEYADGTGWIIDNLQAVFLHEFYQHTDHFEAGSTALTISMEVLDSEHPSFAEGVLEHNVAMNAYSLVARGQPQLETIGGIDKVRNQGLGAARRALDFYLASTSDSDDTRLQIARVRHVLGDLLKVGSASEEERDEAIAVLDLAAAEPALPENMRNAVRQSRATALMRSAAERDLIALLDDNLRRRETFLTLMQLSDLCELEGRAEDALDYLKAATNVARREVLVAGSSADVSLAAEQFCAAFDRLGMQRVAAHRYKAALEAIEIPRAANLRREHESVEEAKARMTEEWRRFRSHLKCGGSGGVRHRPSRTSGGLRSQLVKAARKVQVAITERMAPTPLVGRALRRLTDASWPMDTAICVLNVVEGVISAVILHRTRTTWAFRGLQWSLGEEYAELLAMAHNQRQGPFRARRIERMCSHWGRLVCPDLTATLRSIGAARLAISAPGILSHIPFEALSVDGTALIDKLDVFELPSLSTGAMLADRSATGALHASSALVVTYGGAEELTGTVDEIAALRRSLPGRVDVLDGTTTTKAEVLAAFGRSYGVIHLACHGTFDGVDPGRSQLYLAVDHSSDAKRISAEDLKGVRFPSAPVVTLSACSSGLTSYGMMNDCAGLTGSLLSAGARGIVGSRWPVHDKETVPFMAHLYEQIGSGIAPQTAVAAAQRRARRNQPVDEWAAFSYLGAPQPESQLPHLVSSLKET